MPEQNIELSNLWYNKAVIFSESKEYEKALMAFDTALKYSVYNPVIWNAKCNLLNKLGKYEEAVKVGNVAVQNIPLNVEIWDNLTDAYIGCKNQEKADECQKNVLKLREKERLKEEERLREKERLKEEERLRKEERLKEEERLRKEERPKGDQRRSSTQPGADLLLRIKISHGQAVSGLNQDILVMHSIPCSACNGSGNATKRLKKCPHCGGSGQMRQAKNGYFGQFIQMVTCDQCGGKGKIPEQVCKECRGTGFSQLKEKACLRIPPGIKNGTRLRMEGYGEAGDCGAKIGDLFIEVNVK
jgi:tetratricopeptide (TPR) repeat protein